MIFLRGRPAAVEPQAACAALHRNRVAAAVTSAPARVATAHLNCLRNLFEFAGFFPRSPLCGSVFQFVRCGVQNAISRYGIFHSVKTNCKPLFLNVFL
jgi:hypothetical protein